jgi:hypothetical protein
LWVITLPFNKEDFESIGDLKPVPLDIAFQVQSEDEFQELLDLSNAQIGYLVRVTWKNGEYVKFKRMLLARHRARQSLLHATTREEQMELYRELRRRLGEEVILEEENAEQEVDQVHFEVQSEEVFVADVAPPSLTVQENLAFADGAEATPEIYASMADPTYDADAESTALLADYLKRPVLIHRFTWDESAANGYTGSTFKPWHLYFNDSFIKKKLDNFARIHCRLRLKFVVNASPFYYGMLRAAYTPYGCIDYLNQANDQVTYSQRPGVWIAPHKMTSVELELPFLNPRNWLNVNSASGFQDMGTITYWIYSRLQSANGVSGNNITVSCYAWAEDVKVCAPTSQLAVQSQDEYEEANGVVSAPATAVANVARRLTDVPVIGPFARATELGARAVSGIAKLFGFSNPPVIEDVRGVQPKTFHAFANVETSMPLDKLALDPKNEVTISNDVAGTDSADPLALSNLITRESFLVGTLWDNTKAVDTLLLSWLVTPNHDIYTAGTQQTFHWFTPLSYFANMFRLWRGSIKYKLVFVKSKYHRGRVSISWDPNADITGNADVETSCFTRVVDLEHEDEVEIVVPYKAVTPWLKATRKQNTYSNGPTPTYSYDATCMNGCFTMRVLNPITGPTAAASIDVLLFVSAGPDFQFAVPEDLPVAYSAMEVQSEEVFTHDDETNIDGQIAGITVGESVASLRPLLHRATFWITQCCGQYVTGGDAVNPTFVGIGLNRAVNLLPKIPTTFGYDSSFGMNWAESLLAAPEPRAYTFCRPHPLDWVLNAFVGYRGSTVIHVNVHGESRDNTSLATGLSVSRYFGGYIINATNQNRNSSTSTAACAYPSNVARAATTGSPNRIPTGHRGISLTNQRTQAGVSVVVPQYNQGRFYPAFTAYRQNDNGDTENVRVDTTFKSTVAGAITVSWPYMDLYYAAGVDFNPVFFLSAPRMYEYNITGALNMFQPI